MRAPIFVAATLAAVSAAQAGTSFVMRVSPKRIDVGAYRIWDPGSKRMGPTYAGALAAFGRARTCSLVFNKFLGRDRTFADVHWPGLGVTAEFTTLGGLSAGGTACTKPRGVYLDHLTVSDNRWTTALGLRVGDPISKLLCLYPRARRHGSRYWLITESNPAVGTRPLFSANVSKGRVASFLFIVQAEGE
jgi:hypothetical protein